MADDKKTDKAEEAKAPEKATDKKAPAKKAAPKKAAAKKAPAKKDAEKAEKKPAAKTAAAKKAAPKKAAEPKKAEAEKAEKKPAAKKEAPKKEEAKKADAKEEAPKAAEKTEAKEDKKADAPKPDAKADAPKADASKADAPKADTPKADTPKADAKAEAPKSDAKADAKAEAPKSDADAEAGAHGEQAPGVAETPEVAAAQAEANLKNAGEKAEEQARKGGRSNQRGGPGGGRGGRDNRGGGRGRGRGGRDNRNDDGEELIEKLVHINRVSKTVKGGKRFGFAALVVVGDGKGKAGFGSGKAREVPEAINKATAAAKKAMVRVPLKEGRTLHHDGQGHFGAGKVVVRTAPPGTGIIAGGPMRAVFESLGVADVVTKSNGTANPFNMIRATFEALKDQTSPRSVAQRRGKKVSDLLGRGGMDKDEADATADAVTE